jgi:CubicO group peptidase (beta-lactamase class C family)
MRRNAAMHRVAVMLIIATSVACSAAADSVDDYVRKVMAAAKIPGVSIVVRRDGKVIKSEGYGYANLEHKVPATPETIYQSGSLGKEFTAAGILLLFEDGKLALDDRLSKHFVDAPASWHRMTIRHLLSHTSGLKDYGTDEFDVRKDYTEDEFLAIIKRMPVDFEPGTQWSYSNTGYLLLGILTSRLAGKHWSEFQAERLFAPIGMSTTRVISERDLVTHRAAGYELDDNGELKNQEWVSPSLNRLADGALYFSVKDLAEWDAALDARRFMKPESFEAWWKPVSITNGTTYPYGFGWSIQEQRGHLLIEHGGAWQGFRSAIARYPGQNLAVAVLSNLAQAEPEMMAHAIAGLLEPSLRMPDAASARQDPDANRTGRLRGVLKAWADYRTTPDMARALAATATGTMREAYGRSETGKQLAATRGFRFVGEDDLSERPVEMYGDRVKRIVYYALETDESRHIYRFRLDRTGRVIDFDSEER